MTIEKGTTNEINAVVTDEITAASAKSGMLKVLATPYLIAFMEQAASELCQKYCDDGLTTVGTNINVSHLAATAVGCPIRIVATVTDFDGRKISFDVEAYDNAGLIGKGTHERFSVKTEKFLAKANDRKNIKE